MTGRKLAKKPQFWGGERSQMNYYANILSMHKTNPCIKTGFGD